MHKCDCRTILRCILCVTLLVVGVSPVDAQSATQAPTETPAHRVLELPKNGSADLQQQMFLLQQLKSLLKGKLPGAKSPADLPPELQNLKNMFDKFGGQIPESMLPRPEDISPELIEQVKSNPQLKRQVQQMLEQYQRNGRLPKSNGQGGSQMPLPPNSGNPSPGRPGRQSSTEPPTGPDDSIRPANRRADPGRNGREPLQPSSSTPNGTQPNEPSSSRRADALQRLKEMWDKANPEDSTTPAAQPGQNTQRPGTRRDNSVTPTQPGDGNRPSSDSPNDFNGPNGFSGPLPDSPEGWDKLLNDMIQRQRDVVNGQQPRPNQTPATRPGSTGSSNRQRPGQASDSPNSSSGSSDSSKPSVKEFLEQMQGVVPKDFQPFPSSKNTASTKGDDAAAAQAKRDAVVKRQKETSDSLRDKGLKATLKGILSDAKREAKEAEAQASTDPDAAAGEGGMSTAMIETLDGIRKDVFEMVLDGDITLQENSTKANSGTPNSNAPPQKSESMLGGFREVAGNMISDLSTPDVPVPPDASSAAEAAADAVGAVSLGGWIVPLLVIGLIAVLLAWRTGLLKDVAAVLSNEQPSTTGMQIRTKGDVVRAFHSMALKPVRKTKNWWTHQMVTRDIAAQAPAKSDQVGVLAELYEHARYLPDEQDFTPQQIQDARRALQQCEER